MGNNLKRIRNKLGLSQEKAAALLGTTRNQLVKLESGARRLSDVWIDRAAKAYDVDHGQIVTEESADQGTVPLVGYVGAGAEAHAFGEGQGPFDRVEAPEGATEHTVAVEIRGESLGTLFDQWLVFYDDVRDPPTRDLIGKLCVVGLADGRVLVKKLTRGQLDEKHFNLLSNTEPPIYDAVVAWAARVKQMTPR
jgi:transcriptional regulator with XRE-family HTH domain